jgi:DNA polymerase (family 10)
MISTTAPETFGSALFELTGSERFLAEWRARYGEAAAADSEARIFADSGLPEIPPELREDEAAIDLAENELLPVLIEEADLKGTLHNHSTYSDGAHTLDEMVMAARAMGLSYFGICDHSQSLKIANGLTVDDVRRQQEEIRALNERLQSADPPFRIFSGTESDILADGSLDYPDDVLASFDFVVASVHVGFNMTESQATERVVRAVENPHTRILGHPTGRLLLRREGYPLDHEAVLDACARNRVAVELNANPYRLDLDWRRIRMATEKGVLISINPDAHAIDQLAYTKWGIAVARKGGLTIESCLNAMSLEDFAAWISSRRT